MRPRGNELPPPPPLLLLVDLFPATDTGRILMKDALSVHLYHAISIYWLMSHTGDGALQIAVDCRPIPALTAGIGRPRTKSRQTRLPVPGVHSRCYLSTSNSSEFAASSCVSLQRLSRSRSQKVRCEFDRSSGSLTSCYSSPVLPSPTPSCSS